MQSPSDKSSYHAQAKEMAQVLNETGRHPVVLVCEHASHYIPAAYNDLGLEKDDLKRHIAWDPGADAVSQLMSKAMDAVYVRSNASRLLYDCNRPPTSSQAVRTHSEIYEIPGNQSLSADEVAHRIELFYRPFEALLKHTLLQHGVPPVLVTIHSFNPIYCGQQRDVEIGILHDEDKRLADAILDVASGYEIRRNDPYGPDDDVTHTLRQHGLKNGLLNVMIEIRNDLIASPEDCVKMALCLQIWIEAALQKVAQKDSVEVGEA